jgi:GT2 family glycosyltransferase
MPELYGYRDYLYLAKNHDDFIRKVDQAITEDDEEIRTRRVELARVNTWTSRIIDIDTCVREIFPLVSVIVISYDNLSLTKACLESVLHNSVYPNMEVIVIDNASTDGSPEYLGGLAAEDDRIRVIYSESNLGFAGGNNAGLEIALGDYIVLLNNDTVVPHGWLPRLIRHLRNPEIGLVVSVTNFSGNESRIAVDYRDMEEMDTFAQEHARRHDGEHFDIRVAAMYCVGMRRDVLTTVGPLDEGYTIGMFEDDDYSQSVRLACFRVVCAVDTFVHHEGQASFKKLTAEEYQRIWDHNIARFEAKWKTRWEPHQLRSSLKGSE